MSLKVLSWKICCTLFCIIFTLTLVFPYSKSIAQTQPGTSQESPEEELQTLESDALNGSLSEADQKKQEKQETSGFKQGMKNIGKGFKNLGKATGKGIKKGANATGKALKKAGVTTGQALNNARLAIKKTFQGEKKESLRKNQVEETNLDTTTQDYSSATDAAVPPNTFEGTSKEPAPHKTANTHEEY